MLLDPRAYVVLSGTSEACQEKPEALEQLPGLAHDSRLFLPTDTVIPSSLPLVSSKIF